MTQSEIRDDFVIWNLMLQFWCDLLLVYLLAQEPSTGSLNWYQLNRGILVRHGWIGRRDCRGWDWETGQGEKIRKECVSSFAIEVKRESLGFRIIKKPSASNLEKPSSVKTVKCFTRQVTTYSLGVMTRTPFPNGLLMVLSRTLNTTFNKRSK